MKQAAFSLVLFVAFCGPVLGNVEETKAEVDKRYGKPLGTVTIDRGRLFCYSSGDYRIGVIFKNGISAFESFSRNDDASLTQRDKDLLLKASGAGYEWKLDPAYPRYRYRSDFKMMVSFGESGQSMAFQDPTAGMNKQ